MAGSSSPPLTSLGGPSGLGRDGGGGFQNQRILVSVGDELVDTDTSVVKGERFYAFFDIPAGMEDIVIKFAGRGGDQSGLSGLAFDTAPATDDTIIPEPATMAMLALAGTGLLGYVRRRRG